jgi:hypothetical protein
MITNPMAHSINPITQIKNMVPIPSMICLKKPFTLSGSVFSKMSSLLRIKVSENKLSSFIALFIIELSST